MSKETDETRPLAERTTVSCLGDAVDLYRALAPLGDAILLEDTSGDVRRARSLIAAAPWAVLEWRGDRGAIRYRDGRRREVRDLFGSLRDLARERFGENVRPVDAGAPSLFEGGLLGYFGYDVRTVVARSPDRNPKDSSLPDAVWGVYDSFVEMSVGETVVVTIASADNDHDRARRDRFIAAARDLSPERPRVPPPRPLRKADANITRAEYLRLIEVTKEAIRAGECYQLNLTQRFAVAVEDPPLAIYRRLRERHGSRYAAYFEIDGAAVLSASPECFLAVDRDRIETRPIKGTIARDADPAGDERRKRTLSESVKDRAELTMIVDLMRNDLNHVARPGSVEVHDHAHVESAPTVHHLVTSVTARFESGKDVFDLLSAALPAGSITGCPKIRAMEIIDDLETVRRGVYTGSIGKIGRDGRAELNVAIRTVVIEDGTARVSGGGGITIDSDPASEYTETIDKVKGLLAVLDGEFRE